jgi:hypothetical protein
MPPRQVGGPTQFARHPEARGISRTSEHPVSDPSCLGMTGKLLSGTVTGVHGVLVRPRRMGYLSMRVPWSEEYDRWQRVHKRQQLSGRTSAVARGYRLRSLAGSRKACLTIPRAVESGAPCHGTRGWQTAGGQGATYRLPCQ